jgi:hypothetical protein
MKMRGRSALSQTNNCSPLQGRRRLPPRRPFDRARALTTSIARRRHSIRPIVILPSRTRPPLPSGTRAPRVPPAPLPSRTPAPGPRSTPSSVAISSSPSVTVSSAVTVVASSAVTIVATVIITRVASSPVAVSSIAVRRCSPTITVTASGVAGELVVALEALVGSWGGVVRADGGREIDAEATAVQVLVS